MGARRIAHFVVVGAVLCTGLVAAPAASAPSGVTPHAVSLATVSGAPDARRRPKVTVVSPGPASPTSPTTDRYYNLLQRGRCADLRVDTRTGTNPEDVLFAALADLCLAAKTTSYRADWAAAQAALTTSAPLDDCLAAAARRALSNALANHERTGRKRPDFRPTPTGSACVPQQTQVVVYQPTPESAPTLLVFGLRLFQVDDVKVNGVWLPARSQNAVEGTECARVDVLGWTPPQPGSSVTIKVRGNGYTTAAATASLGAVVSDADLGNLDTNACLISG